MPNEARIKKLEQDILSKQQELETLKKVDAPVIPCKDYTDVEKIAYFDKLYLSALEHLKEAEDNGYVNEDSEHYIFEEVFQMLNLRDPRAIWTYFNKHL